MISSCRWLCFSSGNLSFAHWLRYREIKQLLGQGQEWLLPTYCCGQKDYWTQLHPSASHGTGLTQTRDMPLRCSLLKAGGCFPWCKDLLQQELLLHSRYEVTMLGVRFCSHLDCSQRLFISSDLTECRFLSVTASGDSSLTKSSAAFLESCHVLCLTRVACNTHCTTMKPKRSQMTVLFEFLWYVHQRLGMHE